MPHGRINIAELDLAFNDSTMKIEHGVEIDPQIIQFPLGQRGKQKILKSIVTSFNLLLFDEVVLVEVEGMFYVVDGGHRVRAAKELEFPIIHARVIYGLTMDQANKLCAALNNEKSKFTAAQSHKALSEGHETVACIIEDAKASLGLTKAPISAMRTCYEYGVLQETLEVLAKSGAWEKPRGNGVRFIEGVALFIRDASLIINLDFLTTVLTDTKPSLFLIRDDGSIPNACQVRDKLKAVYNDQLGRRKDLLIP